MRHVDLGSIGARIAHVRASASQKAFADSIGVPLRTFQNYEQGKREPDLRALLGLREQGWNINWILTGDGPDRLEDGLGPASQSLRLDRGRLKSATRLLEMALDMADRELTAERRAAVLADLYEWLADHGDALTPDNLVDFNAYLSARIKTGVSDEGRRDREEAG